MAGRYFIVDAYTSRPFAGNPAGVCITNGQMTDRWMQDVASEMNLSETAFLSRQKNGWEIRWFTPEVEVTLCGHATCAAAHVLVQEGEEEAGANIRFISRSGLLSATAEPCNPGEAETRSAGSGTISLTFPALPATPAPVPEGLEAALGVPVEDFCVSHLDWLVRTGGAMMVEAAMPDMAAIVVMPPRGIILTGAADGGRYDIISRFFAPKIGIPEDPVTGSAHCVLGPYWQRLTGRNRFNAFQASRRGGELVVEVTEGAEGTGRQVILTGEAVTVMKGTLA
ncbi:PhzF family phenazine biosynthesis protein [Methanogenium organophilum]|uniref:PhzF family phenazine biosynthesis protein n=1 Tax=Methanogenium organophilum TaxID=2199 RepID=A0A9X9T966_METOG|nr:PhzF family phenazine biosynthesis protein [Methanogenium organophilum]WAI02111.1 PhzF family phenazine biosynthesis protein [Methanogenium organophilum]